MGYASADAIAVQISKKKFRCLTCLNSTPLGVDQNGRNELPEPRSSSMFDVETTLLLRTIHAEICEGLPINEVELRTRVAVTILDTARQGPVTADILKSAALSVLNKSSRSGSSRHLE